MVSNCVKWKICFKQFFPENSIKRFGTLKWSQEGENSVRHLPTIDLPYTKRRRFPDQPFGLGDSWSAGKLMTFQALFSRPVEFDPSILIIIEVKVCVYVASFETFGSGSFGGPHVN